MSLVVLSLPLMTFKTLPTGHIDQDLNCQENQKDVAKALEDDKEILAQENTRLLMVKENDINCYQQADRVMLSHNIFPEIVLDSLQLTQGCLGVMWSKAEYVIKL